MVMPACIPDSIMFFFQIVTHQQRIFMILKSLAIECEPVDIAGPGMDSQRDYMREKGKKKDGQRNVLPPQIFNGDDYCGVRQKIFKDIIIWRFIINQLYYENIIKKKFVL